MTNKEALQSMTEYYNDNLLLKILIDNGVTSGTTYAASGEKKINLCAADLYGVLAGHPELKEGSRLTKYDSATLIRMQKAILRKYDLNDANINGLNLW